MASRDFAQYHLCEGLLAATGELDGDEDSSRRMHAEAKLRLMSMSGKELRTLAGITSSFLKRPIEVSYQEIKRTIAQHRSTASEWINDLKIDWDQTSGEKMPARILIVGGEPTFVKRLVSSLTRASFSVACVPDHLKALLKLYEFKPDLVIVDEILLRKCGGEAHSQLHQGIFNVPVFVLGKGRNGKATLKTLEIGADSDLKKLSHLGLVARVRDVLPQCKE